MKKYHIILCALYCQIALSQSAFQEVVGAEKSFEKSCLEFGIRSGFLANLDSSAVIFTKGGIENALAFWKELPESAGIYTWSPSFVEVSAGADWAYTTGAVEYRDSLLTDPPASFNQYTTVWYKNNEGKWKYIVDIGNKHGPEKIDTLAKEIRIKKVPLKGLKPELVMAIEKRYIAQLGMDAGKAFNYFSTSFILNANGHALTNNPDSLKTILGSQVKNLIYQPKEIKISPSGDMAVVYGRLNLGNATDNYIRIWRHEVSGWKIALEVARF